MWFCAYDSVFIINRVGSCRSAFPETGRDGTSLTLNVDVNYCSAPWPVPQLTTPPGQALPAADGGVPGAHRRERPPTWGAGLLASVLGLIFVCLPPLGNWQYSLSTFHSILVLLLFLTPEPVFTKTDRDLAKPLCPPADLGVGTLVPSTQCRTRHISPSEKRVLHHRE